MPDRINVDSGLRFARVMEGEGRCNGAQQSSKYNLAYDANVFKYFCIEHASHLRDTSEYVLCVKCYVLAKL